VTLSFRKFSSIFPCLGFPSSVPPVLHSKTQLFYVQPDQVTCAFPPRCGFLSFLFFFPLWTFCFVFLFPFFFSLLLFPGPPEKNCPPDVWWPILPVFCPRTFISPPLFSCRWKVSPIAFFFFLWPLFFFLWTPHAPGLALSLLVCL